MVSHGSGGGGSGGLMHACTIAVFFQASFLYSFIYTLIRLLMKIHIILLSACKSHESDYNVFINHLFLHRIQLSYNKTESLIIL